MNQRGFIFIMALAILLLLVSLVGSFLYAVSVLTSNSGWEETDAKVFSLAEAGLYKAVWDLKTPTGSSGQGENWTTAGTTESLGGGSYTMVVSRYDFALAANGAVASDSPPQINSSLGPAKAIDGNNSTFWESLNNPTVLIPQQLIIAFPYTLTIDKARFLATAIANIPRNYTWQVSTDGTTYTTVVTVTSNSLTDVTNTFVAQSNVNYLKLSVTRVGSGISKIRIATLEAIGSKITSTGTITASGNNYTRTISQTVVADDGSPENQRAYYEPDWVEQ